MPLLRRCFYQTNLRGNTRYVRVEDSRDLLALTIVRAPKLR
jgi:hypothetical protein